MSRVTPGNYVRKPLYVQALQVTNANMADIALWCSGTIEVSAEGYPDEGIPAVSHHIKVPVIKPFNARQAQAFVGDWVIRSSRKNFKVYTDKAFIAAFDPHMEKSETAVATT